jgi:hypothetical protein
MEESRLQLEDKQRREIEDLTGCLPILLEVAAAVLRQVALQVAPATEEPVAGALVGRALLPESAEITNEGDELDVEGSLDRGESTEDWMRSFCDRFWKSEKVEKLVLSIKKYFVDFRLHFKDTPRWKR